MITTVKPISMSRCIFSGKDIDYLVNNFTVEGLHREIRNTNKRLNRETDYHCQMFYEDFIQVCKLAIDIQNNPAVAGVSDNKVSRKSIEGIKTRYDLVDYASHYIKLRKSGNKYNGLCPFHNDRKSASFYVYPDGHFHCFGCQKSGTIIDFVMLIDNLTIQDAIARLAR